MLTPLIKKLEHFLPLPDQDKVSDGSRQILDFMFPGDKTELHSLLLKSLATNRISRRRI